MVRERPAPCVEHGSDPDAGTEVFWVGSDRQHRLGRGAEQQVVDRRLVLGGAKDIRDLERGTQRLSRRAPPGRA
jgi:hypothetical protein